MPSCNKTYVREPARYLTLAEQCSLQSTCSVVYPGFAKGGDHGERVEREPKWGSGAEPPAGSRGRVGGHGGSPPEAESFLYIFIQKKWPKVKDLREHLPPCLSRAAMTSPKFWTMGGRPPGPPIAGSATDSPQRKKSGKIFF